MEIAAILIQLLTSLAQSWYLTVESTSAGKLQVISRNRQSERVLQPIPVLKSELNIISHQFLCSHRTLWFPLYQSLPKITPVRSFATYRTLFTFPARWKVWPEPQLRIWSSPVSLCLWKSLYYSVIGGMVFPVRPDGLPGPGGAPRFRFAPISVGPRTSPRVWSKFGV